MREHRLKCVSPYFEAVREGKKRFEIRFDDRDFKQGDMLILQHYDANFKKFLGFEVWREVEYITDFPAGLREGWVCMSLSGS